MKGSQRLKQNRSYSSMYTLCIYCYFPIHILMDRRYHMLFHLVRDNSQVFLGRCLQGCNYYINQNLVQYKLCKLDYNYHMCLYGYLGIDCRKMLMRRICFLRCRSFQNSLCRCLYQGSMKHIYYIINIYQFLRPLCILQGNHIHIHL